MRPVPLRIAALLVLSTAPALAASPMETGAPNTDHEPRPSNDAAAGPGTAAPDTAPRLDEAWWLFNEAFTALASQDPEWAASLLRRLQAEHPEHPAAPLAAKLEEQLESTLGAPAGEEGSPLSRPERPSALARAELVIFQTAHAIALGGEICAALECNDDRAIVGLLALGGAGGLATSLLTTQNGITPGDALALNSGTLWGFWQGLAITQVSGLEDSGAIPALLAGTQLAGLGMGALIASSVQPTAGDVSMVNSGGIWAGVLTLLVHGTTDFAASDESVWLSLLLASDAGGFGAALLAPSFPMSRGRTLVIDAGGLAGMLLGMGAHVVITGDDDPPGSFYGAAIAGTLSGLVGATYLTRNWDLPDVPARVSLLPTDGGALLSVGYDL